MANHPLGKGRPQGGASPAPCAPEAPAFAEPEMRRWPHPVAGAAPACEVPADALQYIHCALSYQNQLLADIKVLLERLADETASKGGDA